MAILACLASIYVYVVYVCECVRVHVSVCLCLCVSIKHRISCLIQTQILEFWFKMNYIYFMTITYHSVS